MQIVEPGHIYRLQNVGMYKHKNVVTFIKRSGELIEHLNEHSGTNVQECLRMLIDRTIYLDALLTCDESNDAVYYLRMALFTHEARAWRRKMQKGTVKIQTMNRNQTDTKKYRLLSI